MTEPQGSIRLDKWLWHARFCKTRKLAADLIARGGVRLNSRRVTKPATPLRVGDGLAFAAFGQVHALRVRGLGSRRGPAPEARALYTDLDAVDAASTEALEPAVSVDK